MRPACSRLRAGAVILCLSLTVVLCASFRAGAQDKVADKLESYKKELKDLEIAYRKLLLQAVKETSDAEKKASDAEKKLLVDLAKLGAKDKEKRDQVKDELSKVRKELLQIQEVHKYYTVQLNGFRFALGWDKMEDRLGAVVKVPSATLVDQLGLPKGESMVVEAVPAKTLAAKIGLKPHDVMLKIGAANVPNDMTAYKKIVNDVTGDKLTVTVLRQGKQVVVSANGAATAPDSGKKGTVEKKEIPEK